MNGAPARACYSYAFAEAWPTQFLVKGCPANGKRIMGVFESSGLKVICKFYAEAENVRMIPCKKQGGELLPISSNGEDNFATGFILGMCIH